MAVQSKRWCFTLNNYTEEEYNELKEVDCKYIVIGKEVGESGTPHLQGFIIFVGPKRLAAVKRINGRAHWEKARGTSEQAADYCKKDDDFFESGEVPRTAGEAGGEAQQERYKRAWEAAKTGDLDDIPEDILIRHYKVLKEIKKDYMVKPDDASEVTGVWIHGKPGVGKSRKAREDYPGSYLKMQNKWWDGYQGEETVILDDLDSKEMGHLLKIWMDRYSFLAETKGGAIHIRPKKFVVTSNYSIEYMFQHDQELKEAILRRCEVVHLEQPNNALMFL